MLLKILKVLKVMCVVNYRSPPDRDNANPKPRQKNLLVKELQLPPLLITRTPSISFLDGPISDSVTGRPK